MIVSLRTGATIELELSDQARPPGGCGGQLLSTTGLWAREPGGPWRPVGIASLHKAAARAGAVDTLDELLDVPGSGADESASLTRRECRDTL